MTKAKIRSGSPSSVRAAIAALCVSLASAAVESAMAQEADITKCQQTDVASLALRACSHLINSPGVSPAERGRIYTMRGVAWLTEEEPSAAVGDFTRAIELDPTNIAAIKGRARAHSLEGTHAEAAADWTRVIAMLPDQEEFYRLRGGARAAAGKSEEALGDFAKAIELKPGNPDAYMGRADVYDRLGQRDKAVAEFDKAIAISPDYLAIYAARAEMADRWGDKELAIASYRQILRINKVYWSARKALDRLGVSFEHQPP